MSSHTSEGTEVTARFRGQSLCPTGHLRCLFIWSGWVQHNPTDPHKASADMVHDDTEDNTS